MAHDVGFSDGEKGDNSLCMTLAKLSEAPLGGGHRSRKQCHKIETPTMPVGHQVEMLLHSLESEWTLGLRRPGVLGGI